MIAAIAELVLAMGIPQRAARPVAIASLVLIAIGLVCAAISAIRRDGENAGAAKVEKAVLIEHDQRIAKARQDERAAAVASAAVATRTARARARTDDELIQTLGDLHDALDATEAAGGGTYPAAPVERLRDTVNAGIDRANRAADVADAAR